MLHIIVYVYFIYLLTEAVESNNVSLLLELLSYQCDPSPKELTTALEIAVLKKSDDYAPCIEILLAKGGNPSGTNGSGTPFLLLAADAGCNAVVELLLKANCDVDQTREDGTAALHRATWNNHVTCVKMLLDAGANVNATDSQGKTPISLATQSSNDDALVELLNCDQRCDADICDQTGRTAIYWATIDSNLEAMQLLKESGCSVNIQDNDGSTPLMLACTMGDFEAVQFLLFNGANVNLCDTDGDSALLLAAEGQHTSCVDALLSWSVDVNLKNQDSATALLYLMDYPDIVAKFLAAGANANIVTRQGVSPLWIATYNDRPECVKLLLKANCDPTQRAGFGDEKYPLQVALYDGSLAIVQLLFLASVAWGGDLKWLELYLKDQTYQVNCRRYQHVMKCKEWIEQELQDSNASFNGHSLLNACRQRVRQCLGDCLISDKVQELPLPPAIKEFLDLKELDSVTYQASE